MALLKGIKAKTIAAVAVAVVGTSLSLTVITSALVYYTMRLSLKARATETTKILTEALVGRENQLAIRAEVLAQDNDFNTGLSFREVEAAQLDKSVSDGVKRAGATLALVTDLNRMTISTGEVRDPRALLLAETFALRQAVARGLTTTSIEALGGDIAYVAAVPIKRYGVQILGYLVLATVFDKGLVGQLKLATGADIVLERQGKVLAGTAEVQGSLAGVDAALEKTPLVPVEKLTSDGAELLANAMPLRAGDHIEGALLFAVSARDATALQRRVLLASIGLSVLTLLLFGFIGSLIARRISDPIVAIEHSFRKIAASGDLSQRITSTYSDEVGLMATSFNQMQDQIERLHARVVSAEARMRDELKMASTVQEMLVPITGIDGLRCQFASHSHPSTETGGDWFTLIHTPEQGRTICVVADVTGHGAPSALVTAIIHGFFKARQKELIKLPRDEWRAGIESLLLDLNAVMIDATHGSMACSLFALSFDHQTLVGSYVNAGHLAPIQVRNVDDRITVNVISLPPSSLIGDNETPTFAFGDIEFAPNHLFLLYTDGLIECTNAAQEMYGIKRLRKMLQGVGQLEARTARDMILQDAETFFGDTPRADDITLIVGRVR